MQQSDKYNFKDPNPLTRIVEVTMMPNNKYPQDFVKQQNKKAKEDSFKRFNFSCNSYGKNPPFIAAGFPNEKRVERLVDTMKKGVNIYEKLV